MSAAEEKLAWQIKGIKAPPPVREYAFAKPRRYRFDFAWPDLRIAIEVEGGIWIGGAHARGVGISRDVDKSNLAQLLGWIMLRVTPAMIDDGRALDLMEQAFRLRAMP